MKEAIIETSKRVLDPCCGSRMFWFDRQNPYVVFGDCRRETLTVTDNSRGNTSGTRTLYIKPDVLLDFRALPYPDGAFKLVSFDPPHLIHAGPRSWLVAKYGKLSGNWRDDLRAGFRECFRVLATDGVLIFKMERGPGAGARRVGIDRCSAAVWTHNRPQGLDPLDSFYETERRIPMKNTIAAHAESVDVTGLTKTEKSILLYAETCVVDHGGLLEGQRINADDIAALKAWQDKGILTFGRIPYHVIGEISRPERRPTHWVTFTDRAWQMVGALRRLRAETSTSTLRQKVDAALVERATEPVAA